MNTQSETQVEPTIAELVAMVQDMAHKLAWCRNAVQQTEERHTIESCQLRERIALLEHAWFATTGPSNKTEVSQ